MARITNEELKKLIDDLTAKLPNGELQILQTKIEELQVRKILKCICFLFHCSFLILYYNQN